MKKNSHKIIAILLPLFILLPFIALAAPASVSGLIPCDNSAQYPCDFTALAVLINRIITWFLSLSAVVAAVTFAIAGGQMLMNPENPSKREEAIGMFKKTVYGLIIVLVAWLVIKTVVGFFVDPSIGALRFLDVAK